MNLQPIRQSITVRQPPAVAFRVFTEQIGHWWPLQTYSVSQDRARSCVLERRVGGAVFEIRDDGATLPWGRVLVWEPPRQLVLSWHPGRDATVAQEVEIRFTSIPSGSLVELEHRGWEKLGDEAPAVRSSYDGGWRAVLGTHFAEWCASMDGRER